MSSENIRLAIPKGRLLDDVMPLLEKVGLLDTQDQFNNRKLVHQSAGHKVNICITRSRDVPVLLQAGNMDIGVVGSDTLMEMKSVCWNKVEDLEVSKCRLSVIGDNDSTVLERPHLTVATKYPNFAKQYFDELNIQTDIVKMHGSVEMAPLLGIADVALDIVDTGSTLLANGLVEIQKICSVSAHLVTSTSIFGNKRNRIKSIFNSFMTAKEMIGQCPQENLPLVSQSQRIPELNLIGNQK